MRTKILRDGGGDCGGTNTVQILVKFQELGISFCTRFCSQKPVPSTENFFHSTSKTENKTGKIEIHKLFTSVMRVVTIALKVSGTGKNQLCD